MIFLWSTHDLGAKVDISIQSTSELSSGGASLLLPQGHKNLSMGYPWDILGSMKASLTSQASGPLHTHTEAYVEFEYVNKQDIIVYNAV